MALTADQIYKKWQRGDYNSEADRIYNEWKDQKILEELQNTDISDIYTGVSKAVASGTDIPDSTLASFGQRLDAYRNMYKSVGEIYDTENYKSKMKSLDDALNTVSNYRNWYNSDEQVEQRVKRKVAEINGTEYNPNKTTYTYSDLLKMVQSNNLSDAEKDYASRRMKERDIIDTMTESELQEKAREQVEREKQIERKKDNLKDTNQYVRIGEDPRRNVPQSRQSVYNNGVQTNSVAQKLANAQEAEKEIENLNKENAAYDINGNIISWRNLYSLKKNGRINDELEAQAKKDPDSEVGKAYDTVTKIDYLRDSADALADVGKLYDADSTLARWLDALVFSKTGKEYGDNVYKKIISEAKAGTDEKDEFIQRALKMVEKVSTSTEAANYANEVIKGEYEKDENLKISYKFEDLPLDKKQMLLERALKGTDERYNEAVNALNRNGFDWKELQEYRHYKTRETANKITEATVKKNVKKYGAAYDYGQMLMNTGGRVLEGFEQGIKNIGSGDEIGDADDLPIYAYMENTMINNVSNEEMTKDMSGVGSFFYNAVRSTVQSMVNTAPAVALSTVPVVGQAAEALSLMVMSSDAGASSMYEASKRGLSNEKAVATGFASAVAEFLTEKVSLDKATGVFQKALEGGGVGKLLANIGLQGFVEGTEEAGSDILMFIADRYINGGQSEIENNVQKYIAQGYSRKEAENAASEDWAYEFYSDIMAGVVSGVASGGAYTAAGRGFSSAYQRGKEISFINAENAKLGEAITANGAVDYVKTLGNEMGVDTKSLEKGKSKDIGATTDAVINTVIEKYDSRAEESLKSEVIKAMENKGVANAGEVYDTYQKYKQENVGADTEVNVAGSNTKSGLTVGEISEIEKSVINDEGFQKNVAEQEKKYETALDNLFRASAPIEQYVNLDDIEVNSSGKTLNAKSGGTVQISNIADFKGKAFNDMTLNTQNGGTVAAGDVSFGSQDDAIIYKGVSLLHNDVGITAGIANDIIEEYKASGLPAQQYILGVREALRYGYSNQSLDTSGFAEYFTTPEQKLMLKKYYQVGQNLAKKAVNSREEKINARITANRKAGNLPRKTGQITLDKSVKWSRLNRTQKEQFAVANRIVTRGLGVNIGYYESPTDENGRHIGANGRYVPSKGGVDTIWIDVAAGVDGRGVILYTLGHEVAHFMIEHNPTGAKQFFDFLFENYNKKGFASKELLIEDQIERSKNDGVHKTALSYDEAQEEVMADLCQAMFTDTNAAEKIIEYSNNKSGWKQAVIDRIKAIIERLKRFFALSNPDTYEAKVGKQLFQESKELCEKLEKTLIEAVENYQNEGVQSTNGQVNEDGGESKVKYSTRDNKYDFSKSFSEQIEDYKNGHFPKNDSLIVSGTPKIWQKVGFNALPVTINQTHVGYCLNGTKDIDHHIGETLLKQLPNAIKNPVAIIQSQSQLDRAVVVLKITHNGKNVITAVEVDGQGRTNNTSVDSNSLTTLFAKSNVLNQLNNAIFSTVQGKTELFFWNKKEAVSLLQRKGLQLPSALPQDGFVHSIREKTSNVKVKFRDVTETQQFKRWFGKSKVVNEDGTPKVFYHGTNAQFTTFDKSKAKSSGLYGKGFYFTDSESHAGTYGNKMAVYLSIKNPLSPGKSKITDTQIKNFLRAVAEDEGYSIENYGTYDIEKIIEKITDRDAFQVIQDINATAIGDFVEAVHLFNQVNGTNFDGIITPTETVAFEPTQIKSATDNIGTFDDSNPDIRYSTRSQMSDSKAFRKFDREYHNSLAKLLTEKEYLEKTTEKAEAAVEVLKKEIALLKQDAKNNAKRTRDGSRIIRREDVIKTVSGVARDMQLSKEARDYFFERVQKLYGDIVNETGRFEGVGLYWNGIKAEINDIIQKSLEYDDNKALRKFDDFYGIYTPDNIQQQKALAKTKLYINPTVASETGYASEKSVTAFGKAHHLNLTTDNSKARTTPDTFLAELAAEYFISQGDAEVYNDSDALFVIADWADRLFGQMQTDDQILSDVMNDLAPKWLNEIYEGFYDTDTLTTADKHFREMQRLKYEHKQKFEAYKAEQKRLREEKTAKVRQRYEEKLKAQKEDAAERLKQYREKANERLEKTKKEYQQKRKDAIDRRKATELRNAIKGIRKDLIERVEKRGKTDRYIPQNLISAVVDVCDLIDPTGKDQNTKVAEKYRTGKAALLELKEEYEKLKKVDDSDYAGEYDEYINDAISDLADAVANTPLRDMTLEQLNDVYNIVYAIRGTIRDASKQVGVKNAISNYEAGKNIIETMKRVRKNGLNRNNGKYIRELLVNPMRFSREIAGYDKNSQLVILFEALNEGDRKRALWAMNANKFFEKFTLNNKGKENIYFKETVEKVRDDWGFVDLDGNALKMTKQQGMQIILTWEREQANKNLIHLSTGGLKIPNAEATLKGKYQEAVDKAQMTGPIDQSFIEKIASKMNKTDLEFMEAARQFFNTMSKETVNKTSLQTMHRLLAMDSAYIPIEADKDYVRRESEGVKYDASITSMPMLKSTVKGAQQPLVIRGLYDVLQNHIEDVSKFYGFAAPIKNINKALNVKMTLEDGGKSVKAAISEAWGRGALKQFQQAVDDLQTERPKSDHEIIQKTLQKISGAFVVSKLANNISVTMKQAASYTAAGAYLSSSSLTKAAAKYAKDFRKRKNVYAEIDRYTGRHYERRKGLSTVELGDFAQSKGKIKKISDKMGVLSPFNWIQAVDVGTTGALWYACKEEIKKQGIISQSEDEEAYFKAVADLYDKVLEETQPMYDSLHRVELSKGNVSKRFFLFQTQPMQNAGIFREGVLEYKAAKKEFGANSEQAKVAKNKMARAIASQIVTSCVFVAMTQLSRAILHKINPWRDKETGEVEADDFFRVAGLETLENFANVVVPFFGGKAWDVCEDLISGISMFYGGDVIQDSTVDYVNEVVKSLTSLSNPSIKDVENAVFKIGSLFGLPFENAKNIAKGLRYSYEDFVNGDFGEFKAGTDYTNSQNGARLYNAVKDGDNDKTSEVMGEFENKSDVRTALNGYIKPIYLEAVESDDKDKISEIKSVMTASGLYDDVDKTLDGFIKNQKKANWKNKVEEAYRRKDYAEIQKIKQEMVSSGYYAGTGKYNKSYENVNETIKKWTDDILQ